MTTITHANQNGLLTNVFRSSIQSEASFYDFNCYRSFKTFSGTITTQSEDLKCSNSIFIDVNSISTNQEMRDNPSKE